MTDDGGFKPHRGDPWHPDWTVDSDAETPSDSEGIVDEAYDDQLLEEERPRRRGLFGRLGRDESADTDPTVDQIEAMASEPAADDDEPLELPPLADHYELEDDPFDAVLRAEGRAVRGRKQEEEEASDPVPAWTSDDEPSDDPTLPVEPPPWAGSSTAADSSIEASGFEVITPDFTEAETTDAVETPPEIVEPDDEEAADLDDLVAQVAVEQAAIVEQDDSTAIEAEAPVEPEALVDEPVPAEPEVVGDYGVAGPEAFEVLGEESDEDLGEWEAYAADAATEPIPAAGDLPSDAIAETTALDEWIESQPPPKRRRWFGRRKERAAEPEELAPAGEGWSAEDEAEVEAYEGAGWFPAEEPWFEGSGETAAEERAGSDHSAFMPPETLESSPESAAAAGPGEPEDEEGGLDAEAAVAEALAALGVSLDEDTTVEEVLAPVSEDAPRETVLEPQPNEFEIAVAPDVSEASPLPETLFGEAPAAADASAAEDLTANEDVAPDIAPEALPEPLFAEVDGVEEVLAPVSGDALEPSMAGEELEEPDDLEEPLGEVAGEELSGIAEPDEAVELDDAVEPVERDEPFELLEADEVVEPVELGEAVVESLGTDEVVESVELGDAAEAAELGDAVESVDRDEPRESLETGELVESVELDDAVESLELGEAEEAAELDDAEEPAPLLPEAAPIDPATIQERTAAPGAAEEPLDWQAGEGPVPASWIGDIDEDEVVPPPAGDTPETDWPAAEDDDGRWEGTAAWETDHAETDLFDVEATDEAPQVEMDDGTIVPPGYEPWDDAVTAALEDADDTAEYHVQHVPPREDAIPEGFEPFPGTAAAEEYGVEEGAELGGMPIEDDADFGAGDEIQQDSDSDGMWLEDGEWVSAQQLQSTSTEEPEEPYEPGEMLEEDMYAGGGTVEHRGLADAMAAAGDDETEWQAMSAAMPGVETGVLGFEDVADLASGDEYVAPVRSNFGLRVITGIVLVGLLIGSLLVAGWAFAVFVGLVVLLGLAEFYGTLRRVGLVPLTLFGMAGGLGTLTAVWFHGPVAIPSGILLTSVVTFFFYAFATTRQDSLSNGGMTVLGLAWVVGAVAFAIPIAKAEDYQILIIAIVAVTAAMDIGAYSFGRTWGKRPLASVLSPNKTIEGLVGGILLAMAAGSAFGYFEVGPFDFMAGLALGAVVVVAAPLGDLAESLLKRSMGVKDMGSTLPGHGGILDRIDALLFVIPAAWVLYETIGYLD